MKSYTLANWDGSLANGTSSSSRARQDSYGVQAQATPDRPNGAFNVEGWKIPVQDTHHRYASGTRATDEWTEGHTSGPNSRMNGIQPGDASLKTSTKGRRVVNGYTTYKRNDGPLSAQVKTKQSPSRLGPVRNGTSNTSSSRTFLPQTPPRTRATRRGRPLIETTVQNGRMIGDEGFMDVDDVSSLSSLSSADAEGDEDDEDVSFVNDMLISAEPSSKSPITTPSDNREPSSPLSPLFTPPSAKMHLNTTSEKNSTWSSPVQLDLLTPPPDTTPAASTSQVADTLSFTISAEGSSVEATAQSGSKRRKRMVISHIAVPPFPASVSQGSYRSISSLPLKTRSKLMSRPAKVLAQIRVQKTLDDGVRVARQHNLNLGSMDDRKDPTYKPAPSAVSKQNENSGSSRISLRETAATSRRTPTSATTIKESSVVKPDADVETNISIVRTSHVIRTSTPQPLVPAAAPSSTQIRSSLPPLPSPGTGEKRKYQKRSKDEEREVDSSNSKSKKTKVVRVGKGKEPMIEVDVIPPKERPKKHRRVRASAYSRYNSELGVLRIFFHGIPTTRHSVLEMNIRHIRREKGVNEEHGSQTVDSRLEMTQEHEISSSWFVWPPLDLDQNEEEYYLGGLSEELIDEDEEKLELRRTKMKDERYSTSYTIVSDEPSSIPFEPEAGPSPPPRSPTIVSDDIDQPSRPSAKALGKRKATSSLQVGHTFSPVTPQRSTYELQDSGRVESDHESILQMEQFLQDPMPSPYYPQFLQSSGGGVDSMPNLSIATAHHISVSRHHSSYDSETLSRALISADNDPFICGVSGTATNDADSFLALNSGNTTISSWPETSGLAGDVYKGFNETAAVNNTIDPLLLRSPPLAGPADLVNASDLYQQQAHLIYSPSHSILDPNVHDLQSSPSFPLSASIGRRPLKTRRPSDMIDITDLDLGSSIDSSDKEMDADCEGDGVYVPSISTARQVGQDGQRRGPRIVSAKELARIQKRKALEKEKERERERERERLEKEKASAMTSAITSGTQKTRHPRSKFACGTEAQYCHQCRRRTYYLKMKCECGKLYCNRCISTRYDNLFFDESNPEWTCPVCLDSCTCDYCTKKRGEVYISLRRPKIKRDTSEQMISRGSKKVEADKVQVRHQSSSEPEFEVEGNGPTGWSSSSEDEVELPASGENQVEVIRVPKPLPPTRIVGIPGSYWGNVYSLTGEKIGTAMVGEGNQTVTLDCSLSALLPASEVAPPQKRVFVGCRQPCWGNEISKIRVLEEEDAGTVKRLTRWENTDQQRRVTVTKRVYIGDPKLFLKRVVMPTKQVKEDGVSTAGAVSDTGQAERTSFAYSLSPLSSLSSLPGSESEKDETKNKVGVTLDDGLQLDSGLEPKVKKTNAKTKKRKSSRYKRAVPNDDVDIGNSLGKQDGVQLENKAVKDGHKVEMEERTKAEKDGEEQKQGARARSASFSPDSLGDNDVARAILLSFSACSMPVNV